MCRTRTIWVVEEEPENRPVSHVHGDVLTRVTPRGEASPPHGSCSADPSAQLSARPEWEDQGKESKSLHTQ